MYFISKSFLSFSAPPTDDVISRAVATLHVIWRGYLHYLHFLYAAVQK